MVQGDHFGGKSIPLGAYVHVKPSPTRDETHKFAPRSMKVVFAGYELNSGVRWSGEMLVWQFDKFLDADLTEGMTHTVEGAVPRIDRKKSRKGLALVIRLGMLMQPLKGM